MTKTTTLALLLATLTAGCSAPPPSRDETARIEHIVWDELLQAPGSPPPFEWVADGGPCLDSVKDMCADGMYDGTVAFAVWKGTIPATALAHELIHAWLLASTGDGDREHKTGAWYREAKINQVLEWRGY